MVNCYENELLGIITICDKNLLSLAKVSQSESKFNNFKAGSVLILYIAKGQTNLKFCILIQYESVAN
jgi:hypothetical protein